MPNNNATNMICEQIERELDRLNSIFPDEEEKTAIIQRIADLKAMLDTPTSEKMEQLSQPTTRELIAEFIKAIRNR
jgi:hypothetical protein